MPELPEVESYRRFFRDHAAGRTVADLEADPTIVRNATPAVLRRALRGRRFVDPQRHGKWLLGWTDGPALLLHFGMTGDLVSSTVEPHRHRHDRLTISFTDGTELRYRNMRKLGGVWLAHDADEVHAIIGTLGPDALDLPRRTFVDRLARRRGGVKAALMDQRMVAGVGNLLADEILWRARLHPLRRIESLREDERGRLFEALRTVVGRSARADDPWPRPRTWLLSVRGEPGARCPRCRSPLERTVVGGRTTWFCPACQPRAPA